MKKRLLATAAASMMFFAGQSAAEQATGTAQFKLVQPITVTETTVMEFGNIDISADGNCTLDYANTVTGAACLAGGNTSESGVFTITANDGDVNVTLSGADTSVAGVTFTPSIASSTVTVASNTATLVVGGSIDIVAASASSGDQTISYTVDVIY
ncbi:DUF4402 domain-containing protein [Shewanella waksmanii]|uniref:DUF4402 domain-containing protein n=1 Tax=Shewanella waksmanii TaxID=213783 RepID=UPI0004B230E9|nr:DUF4402 domain-containing protein [Shewanella waksmanii]